MSVRPIVLLGDPRLRLRGETVDSFGKALHELLDDLTDSMRHAPGVGLAAPQLGEPLRACVIEVEDTLYELVNPQIVRAHGDDRDLEGCLSIPGYVAYVTRREKVTAIELDLAAQSVLGHDPDLLLARDVGDVARDRQAPLEVAILPVGFHDLGVDQLVELA